MPLTVLLQNGGNTTAKLLLPMKLFRVHLSRFMKYATVFFIVAVLSCHVLF